MCTHSRVAATSLSWRIPFSYHRNAHVDHPHDRTDYRYDPVGRLLESIGPAGKERFAFDPASNIIDPARVETARKESRPSPVRAESSLPPEVPKVLGNLLKQYAGQHFEYDARGNLVQRRSPAGEQRYEWDPFNRLTAASVEETARRSESRYYYDALGRRIAKEVNGERTVFGWDGDTLAYESGEQGSTHYLYEADSFVPMVVQYVGAPINGLETPLRGDGDRYVPEDDPLQRVPERVGQAHIFHYHCDQLGTPQFLTDDYGDVVWEAEYKAWGEAQKVIARTARATGITSRNSLRFQGQQFDEETGFAYNRHRYYDSNLDRFISKDPVGLSGGSNLYQYASNPVEWIDPLGLSGRKEHKPRIEDGNSKEGWQHIDERHISGTHSSGAGDLFPPETSREELQRVCECLVKNGTRISDPKRRIQTYEKRVKVSGKRARVRGSFDSHDKNRTITLFPAESG